jgi:deoxyribodipyrimidine photolyase
LIEIERQITRNEKFIANQRALVAWRNGQGTFAKVAENLRELVQTQALSNCGRERVAKELEIQAI